MTRPPKEAFLALEERLFHHGGLTDPLSVLLKASRRTESQREPPTPRFLAAERVIHCLHFPTLGRGSLLFGHPLSLEVE